MLLAGSKPSPLVHSELAPRHRLASIDIGLLLRNQPSCNLGVLIGKRPAWVTRILQIRCGVVCWVGGGETKAVERQCQQSHEFWLMTTRQRISARPFNATREAFTLCEVLGKMRSSRYELEMHESVDKLATRTNCKACMLQDIHQGFAPTSSVPAFSVLFGRGRERGNRLVMSGSSVQLIRKAVVRRGIVGSPTSRCSHAIKTLANASF